MASGKRTLSRILPRGEVTENDVFVDFGAGKGRVLLQAARYPFKRVIGVEISAELAATAHRNLQHLDRRLRDKVEIVVADVLDYEVPDEVTVAYFYNPFYGQVFERVVDKLRNSVSRSPRSLRIVYRTPIEEKYLFDAEARLLREARGPRFWSSTSSTRLYVMRPRRLAN